MAWVKLDDKRAMHAKLRQAGREARGLDEAAICQIAADETDGFISTETVETLAVAHRAKNWRRIVDRLVDARRWVPVDGGWEVLGYLDFNPSHAELEELRAKRSAAGRKGGNRRSKPEANGQASALAKREANARAPAQANTEATAQARAQANAQAKTALPARIPSRPVPNSSSSAVTETAAPQPSDDDDPDLRKQAINLLAERDLARRIADKGPVGHADGWLEAARNRRRTKHQDTLDQLDLSQFQSAEALANYLEPPRKTTTPTDPTEATATAARALRERADIDCPDCESTGWTNADPTQGKCQTCRKLCPI